MGPQLASPRTATCSTTIETTTLQLWRMHLKLLLSEHDAAGGWGEDITVFVGPDGQPGMTTANALEP